MVGVFFGGCVCECVCCVFFWGEVCVVGVCLCVNMMCASGVFVFLVCVRGSVCVVWCVYVYVWGVGSCGLCVCVLCVWCGVCWGCVCVLGCVCARGV